TAIANAYATVKIVSQQNPAARMMLVVNMVNSSSEGAAVSSRLNAITRQFLDREVEYAGCIPLDPAVPRAIRQRIPFVSCMPRCAAAAGIDKIVRRLGLAGDAPRPSSIEGFLSSVQRCIKSNKEALFDASIANP
ncbi:MAG TPA: hypothetical protein VKT77_17835, partial [Chthonomonadaceae bacterium]|nr:hypothetical protein [Chthonomonadaceae bacterium]